jgi:hypothetical protein
MFLACFSLLATESAFGIRLKVQRPALPYQPLVQALGFALDPAHADTSSAIDPIGSFIVTANCSFIYLRHESISRLNSTRPHRTVLIEAHLIHLWGINPIEPILNPVQYHGIAFLHE